MKNRKRFDQINVIPFIDIMLVLLVMVLTTATFIKQGVIPVDLPKAEAAKKEEKTEEFNIYIKKDGTLYIDKRKVSSSELRSELEKIDKKQTVVLRSDKEATFQNFVSVMDMLKALNHEQLYIITKE